MKKVRNKLAFGVFWSNRNYLLSRAKFPVMAEAIRSLAENADRPLRILDAGIGRCRLQRYFAVHFPETKIDWHGLDLLEFRLRIHDEVPGIRRVRGRVDALPYADQSFDAVVCCWVLQHLEDPEGTIAELGRVLKPGGSLLLAVPNSPQPVRWVQEKVHAGHVERQRSKGQRFSYLPQIQFYNQPRLKRILRERGLEIDRWQGIGFVTGGPIAFLENYRWYYDLHLWAGARIPRLTKQLVAISKKQPSA